MAEKCAMCNQKQLLPWKISRKNLIVIKFLSELIEFYYSCDAYNLDHYIYF